MIIRSLKSRANRLADLAFSLLFIPAIAAYAETSNNSMLDKFNATDINSMMANLTKNMPDVVRLIIAVSYIMGIWFIYTSIRELKAYGEARTMMPSDAKFGPPMIRLMVGTILLFVPGLIDISTYSLWGYDSSGILLYPTTVGSDPWGPALKGAIAIIRVIGYIAFIRGFTMIVKGAKGTTPGATGHGITHIVGGIMAINIVGTISLIKVSLGLDAS